MFAFIFVSSMLSVRASRRQMKASVCIESEIFHGKTAGPAPRRDLDPGVPAQRPLPFRSIEGPSQRGRTAARTFTEERDVGEALRLEEVGEGGRQVTAEAVPFEAELLLGIHAHCLMHARVECVS